MFYLKPCNSFMDLDEYEMFQEIPKYENGNNNKFNGTSFKEFKNLMLYEEKYKNLMSYVFYEDDYPIGRVSINLEKSPFFQDRFNSDIGYTIRPSKRNKGYANIMFDLALEVCKENKLDQITVTCFEDNVPSNKVIEKNGGVLSQKVGNINVYKLDISQKNKLVRVRK